MNRAPRPLTTFALLLSLLLAPGGCGPRTLTVVDPCPDGGASTFRSCPQVDGPVSTLSRGLVGHWRFDDGAGSPSAYDSSENGNNGMFVDLDPATVWVAGHVGSSALNTDAKGFAAVAKSRTIDSIVGQVTLAGWMYLDGPIMDYATIASRQIPGTNNQYYHIAVNQLSRPSLFIHTLVPSSQVAQPLGPASDPVPLQQWTHLAGSYDGATARLYVNGALIDSRAVTGEFGPYTTPFILGGNGNGNMITERFPGRIDEIVLYNRVLDEGEIGQLAAGANF